jgi:hypothetical protein
VSEGELRLEIVQSEDNDSPREWDNLGTIIAWHSRYQLSDDHVQGMSPDEFHEWADSGELIVRRIRAYEHGGIALTIGEAVGQFADPWDSHNIGYIFVERLKVLQEWKRKRMSKKLMGIVQANLESEVRVFSQYLNGEVYGYQVWRTCPCCGDGEILDSCYGYYDRDHCKQEGQAALEYWKRKEEDDESGD